MSNELTLPTEPKLSIFQIESELSELMEFRDTEELTPEERQAVDTQIADYVSRELTKVDNLRAYLRHCEVKAAQARAAADIAKEEVSQQLKRASSWETRLEYLKGCCLSAMSILGKKRLEGRTGYLLAKGNGGKQALTIYAPSLIPEPLVMYRGYMRPEAMAAIPEQVRGRQDFIFEREPMPDAIRAQMNVNCARCLGTGQCTLFRDGVPESANCLNCQGTGKQIVPGARLEPRGSHIEVK